MRIVIEIPSNRCTMVQKINDERREGRRNSKRSFFSTFAIWKRNEKELGKKEGRPPCLHKMKEIKKSYCMFYELNKAREQL